MFSASSIEPVSIPIERRVKTFDRLLSAPISLYSLVSGESLSGFLYSLGIACIPLAVGVVIFSTPIVYAPILANFNDIHSILFCNSWDTVRCIPYRERGGGYVDAQHCKVAAYLYFRCFYSYIFDAPDRSEDRTDISSHLWK